MTISPAFVKKIPKTDLHVHLDGSLRLETLIELARSRRIALPSESPAGLEELVFTIDPQAFVIFERTFNVLGKGFSRRKVY